MQGLRKQEQNAESEDNACARKNLPFMRVKYNQYVELLPCRRNQPQHIHNYKSRFKYLHLC